MRTLGKAAEARLLGALDKVAELTEDGQDPNEAIAAAVEQDREIPAGHVPLLVQAYNTGRTSLQRKQGSTAAVRAAEFPLASSEVVLSRLYPTASSAAESTKQAVSEEFSRPPRVPKQANNYQLKPLTDRKYEPLPPDPFETARRAALDKNAEQRKLASMRANVVAMRESLMDQLGNLVQLLKQADQPTRNDAAANIRLLHGSLGDRLLDVAASRGVRFKEAGAVLRPAAGPIYEVAQLCLAGASRYAEMQQQYAAKTKTAAAVEPDRLLGRISRPFDQKSAGLFSSTLGAGTALTVRDLIYNTMGKIPWAGEEANKEIGKSVLELEDPGHAAEMRRINSQAVLNDLVSNDSVISGYDPHEVTEAYNEIVRLSPRVADQSLALRALLRKRLAQGHLDTFEVSELSGLENKLKQREEIPGGAAHEQFGRSIPALYSDRHGSTPAMPGKLM